MKTKLNLSAIYLTICLILLFAEPKTVSLRYYFAYYVFIFLNVIIAVRLINTTLKKHDTSKN